jgi:hypothetical protein
MGFVLVTLLAMVIEVRVTTLDGKARDGELLSITNSSIEVQSNGSKESIATDQLLSLQRIDSATKSSPLLRVELLNGSRVAVTEVTTNQADAVLQTRDQPPLMVPLKQIRWIRFRPATPAVDPQWLGILEADHSSDVIVVRRSGNALDEVQGIVKSISATAVTIDLDGDELVAPIEKLEGILFGSIAAEPRSSNIIVEDLLGSRWMVESIESGENNLVRLMLGSGASHTLPLDQLKKVETVGSVQFLAAESPVESVFQPTTSIGLNKELAARWLSAFGVDDRDLVLHANSHAEYRVDDRYSSLVGSAQFDHSVTSGGKCTLRILFDGEVVWDQTFDVETPSPRGYELPLGKARRVRFEVKDAGDGDIGDTLKIRQPRLVK